MMHMLLAMVSAGGSQFLRASSRLERARLSNELAGTCFLFCTGSWVHQACLCSPANMMVECQIRSHAASLGHEDEKELIHCRRAWQMSSGEDIWQLSSMKGGELPAYVMAEHTVLASPMHVVTEALVKKPTQAMSRRDNRYPKCKHLFTQTEGIAGTCLRWP